ncbi:glycoside hydrolase family 16 protein [Flagelloscypha sp. PMI_526]|nr:glycoside hydrolase family 16 protein [Flagelloscypha sp. PMI_526]
MYTSTLLVPVALLLARFVSAQGATCNVTSPCSKSSAPCCSEFGFCGDDDFCLGGCNPFSSKSIDACRPNPVCKDATYTFPSSKILSNSTYFDGNASAYDFVIDKGNIMNGTGEVVLLLTKENGGTRLSSTRYFHYGTISAKLKTARSPGVVTAFITMSSVKDEIDWEFPGTKTTEGQTNFFWQGNIPEKTAGDTSTGLSDTFSNYHEFGIDWQKDALSWLIDGKVVRTIKASDFSGKYPTTPARIQLSLWPAGVEGMPQGTVDWSGGMIDYSDKDYQAQGHFAAYFQSITVKCADPSKPGANDTSYVYSDNNTNPTIAFSNASTMLNGVMTALSAPSGLVLSMLMALMCITTSFMAL